MQRGTSIGSRITWFAIAAIILVATCLVGLRILPVIAEVGGSFGVRLPRGMRAVFMFGPAVLVTVGVITAVLTVMGEFKPTLRGFRPPLIILVLFLIASSLATALALMESFSCS